MTIFDISTKGNIMTTIEHIFTNKLFTKPNGGLMNLGEVMKVSLVGQKPLSRRNRIVVYSEYKRVYTMDKLRAIKDTSVNKKTNLAIMEH